MALLEPKDIDTANDADESMVLETKEGPHEKRTIFLASGTCLRQDYSRMMGTAYRIPDHRVEGLVSPVPPDFLFTFKVTDEIMIKPSEQLFSRAEEL